ncbi:hypothetical protein FKW77_008228 [Venturia effusa]|uniref:Rhodopsin domain-containing protein n=1 Tax=Venturia effusa TaxID=50376 RepID=A0A517LKM8_9PEZI|nr:hypothetical protein FKW77_008228 [Venturia effusa]
MTRGTTYNLFVKISIAYCILGLLIIESTYFFTLCRPFTQYWAVPVKNPQCATYFYYCIIQMVFNISSDILMLFIPVPFILNSKVPPMKRAMLIAIFSLGIFVILAAVLNKYYNFALPYYTVYMVWDIRETGTSIMVANVMCLWPLIRKMTGWSSFLRHGSGSNERSLTGVSTGALTPEPVGAVFRLKALSSRDEEVGGYRNLEEDGKESERVHFHAV